MNSRDDSAPVEQATEISPEREAMLRAAADYENAKARIARDARDAEEATRRDLVARLLPILDNLERAGAAADPRTDRALLQGIELVRTQLEDVLESYGVVAFESLGAPFDPREHEAVAMDAVRDPARHRTVVGVESKGYRLGDALLRPARVRVGQHPALAAGVRPARA